MKTFKNLYPQIYAFGNLYQAFRAARKGGKRKQVEVATFEFDGVAIDFNSLFWAPPRF